MVNFQKNNPRLISLFCFVACILLWSCVRHTYEIYYESKIKSTFVILFGVQGSSKVDFRKEFTKFNIPSDGILFVENEAPKEGNRVLNFYHGKNNEWRKINRDKIHFRIGNFLFDRENEIYLNAYFFFSKEQFLGKEYETEDEILKRAFEKYKKQNKK